MSNGMKVIHAPLEIAGQMGLICEFLKKNGIHSAGYNFFTTYLNYKKVIQADSYELAKLVDTAVHYFDLFHFHNGYTFLDDQRDLPFIANAGKKIIMHHRGTDVRSRSRAARWKHYENPYVNADCSIPDAEIDKNLRFFSNHASAAIVQDYELYAYVEDYYKDAGKKVYVLPRLIDTRKILPVYEPPKSDAPLIVHAPTQREFKGTQYVEKAIEQLQREIPCRYRIVEGMSHAKAMQLYKEADIIIDQMLCGAYGNLSVEAMALGKPVVCYIRPDLFSKYPEGLPIVSANPDNLFDTLKTLVRNREFRVQRGRMGRKYVEKYHAADKVIKKLVNIYKEVLGENRS